MMVAGLLSGCSLLKHRSPCTSCRMEKNVGRFEAWMPVFRVLSRAARSLSRAPPTARWWYLIRGADELQGDSILIAARWMAWIATAKENRSRLRGRGMGRCALRMWPPAVLRLLASRKVIHRVCAFLRQGFSPLAVAGAWRQPKITSRSGKWMDGPSSGPCGTRLGSSPWHFHPTGGFSHREAWTIRSEYGACRRARSLRHLRLRRVAVSVH